MVPETSLVTIVNKLILVSLPPVLSRIAKVTEEHWKQQHKSFVVREERSGGFTCLVYLSLVLVNLCCLIQCIQCLSISRSAKKEPTIQILPLTCSVEALCWEGLSFICLPLLSSLPSFSLLRAT